jgi:hypothetical protein
MEVAPGEPVVVHSVADAETEGEPSAGQLGHRAGGREAVSSSEPGYATLPIVPRQEKPAASARRAHSSTCGPAVPRTVCGMPMPMSVAAASRQDVLAQPVHRWTVTTRSGPDGGASRY